MLNMRVSRGDLSFFFNVVYSCLIFFKLLFYFLFLKLLHLRYKLILNWKFDSLK